MSAASAVHASLEHRDIRSAALPFKRDKDHNQKWSNGERPLAGVRFNFNEDLADVERQPEKVRPLKAWNLPGKSHANKAPKPNGRCSPRLVHKVDALVDANDQTYSSLSKSLLELLPQHVNNTHSPIQTAIHSSAPYSEILYSFDNKGPSPVVAGRKVDLGDLVDLAEKKWAAEQTDMIVKGEYEVLDSEGETTIIASKKKKGSPKQKATTWKSEPFTIKSSELYEDEGFELI